MAKGYKGHLNYPFPIGVKIVGFSPMKLPNPNGKGMNFVLCRVLEVTNHVNFGRIDARMISSTILNRL
jgi:hypothetical protein